MGLILRYLAGFIVFVNRAIILLSDTYRSEALRAYMPASLGPMLADIQGCARWESTIVYDSHRIALLDKRIPGLNHGKAGSW